MTGLSAGSTLQNGKYVIDRILGQGGFGITYLATHSILKKKIAIKEFFPSVYCERGENSVVSCSASNKPIMQKLKAKFTKEAKNIASLHHPNIITIFDIFDEYGTAYYVMDYVEGCSLHELVKQEGILQHSKIIKYIGEIGSALDYIHSLKIGHYDVKPGNILINKREDRAVLIDFGLSKRFTDDNDEQSSSLIGHSNGYAPIEQYDQSSKLTFSPTTDTYSLTATLYYLLCGERPQTSTEIVSQGLKIPESVPEKIKKIIRKGMSVQQGRRYDSCKKITTDLESAYRTNIVIEFVNETRTIAGNVLKKISPISHDSVPVLSVSESDTEDSTTLNHEVGTVAIVEKPLYALKTRNRKKWELLTWFYNHPRFSKSLSLICNILTGLFITLSIYRCCQYISHLSFNDVSEYGVNYYTVSTLLIHIALAVFTLLLWIYTLTGKKHEKLKQYISMAYALSWVTTLYDALIFDWFEVVMYSNMYLLGLITIYVFYKLTKEIEIAVLSLFSFVIYSNLPSIV